MSRYYMPRVRDAGTLRRLPIMAAAWLALQHIIRNPQALWRMSKMWVGITAGMTLALVTSPEWGALVFSKLPGARPDHLAGNYQYDPLISLVVLLGQGIAMTAVAIAWHRYILRGEQSSDPVQLGSDVPLLGYILRAIAYSFAGALAFGMLTALVFLTAHLSQIPEWTYLVEPRGTMTWKNVVWLYLMFIPLMYVVTKLSIRLPALAVGDRYWNTSAVWRDSKVLRRNVLGVVIAGSAFGLLMHGVSSIALRASELLFGAGALGSRVVSGAIQFGSSWATGIFAFAVLTALFGLLNRDIDLEEGKLQSPPANDAVPVDKPAAIRTV